MFYTLFDSAELKNLIDIYQLLKELEDFNPVNIESKFKELAACNKFNLKDYNPIIRVALSGQTVGPAFYGMLSVLGKETVVERIFNKIFAPELQTYFEAYKKFYEFCEKYTKNPKLFEGLDCVLFNFGDFRPLEYMKLLKDDNFKNFVLNFDKMVSNYDGQFEYLNK